ncbi:SEFIR domain-containing protein [Amycolatopsis sp. NPDC003731]
MGTAGTSPRIYVSYAHDSAEHDRAVREFATFLREKAGVDAQLDVWYTDRRRDWTAWTIGRLREAEFVLAIASPQYKHIVDGRVPSAAGSAKVLEAAMLRDNLARDLPGETRRILPVVLPGHDAGEIPECLCAHSTTHYAVEELTLPGVRNLLAALAGTPLYEMPPLVPFVVPEHGVDPVVVGVRPAPSRPAELLTAEAEVEIGGVRYLVHGDPLEDAALRQARALRLGPPHEDVWLRQVDVRRETPAALAASAALTRERDLLTALRGNGFPAVRELVRENGVVTLVTAWPGSKSATLADFVPQPAEVIDAWRSRRTLSGLAGLGRTLTLLHARGATHRLLTPAGLVRFDDGRVVLRDLGLAGTDFRPGEGTPPYQAPEQRVRSAGRVGPWTDVRQLAAVAYHVVTGFAPDPAVPVPVRQFATALPERAAVAIDAALATDPASRPAMRFLAAALDHRR